MTCMKVLVIASSRHGATTAIAQAIAEELNLNGCQATVATPADVTSLDDADGVVLGSAVYMTQWLEPMRNFIAHHGAELRAKPLWAFSCGLAGVPSGNVQDPRRIGPALLSINPIDHQTFKGRLDFGVLSLRERSIARLGNAPEGDYREWDKIRAWARQIAADLVEHLPESDS